MNNYFYYEDNLLSITDMDSPFLTLIVSILYESPEWAAHVCIIFTFLNTRPRRDSEAPLSINRKQ